MRFSCMNRQAGGPPSLRRRLSAVVVLSTSLIVSSTAPGFARNRGGGGGYQSGGYHSGGYHSGGYHSGGYHSGGYHGGGASYSRPTTQGRPSTVSRPSYGGGSQIHGAPHNSYNRSASVNAGNRNVNINRGHDVNIQRNTVVRAAPRPYGRPPYAYGGRRYYAYHPYGYHAYRPYYWGAGFHPFGAFVATVAATAIVVSIANQQYRYDQGVWYAPTNGGYAVVTAPVGATVATVPPGTVVVNNNYYYGGTYYEKAGSDYQVVAPTAGTVVDHLPEGGEEATIGDQKYVKFGETYYQPIQQDGKDRYEVIEVK